jgi:protein tyrosine kinase modulator
MNGIYEEIRTAIHSVWQRRWLALAVAWGICLVGWLAIALIPNSYESTAHVFVQMQSLLPGKVGITEMEQQKDIDRVQQTLASTVNLEKVVRGSALALQATSDKDVANLVAKLRRDITIKAQQDNLFEISAKASGAGLSDRDNASLAKTIVQKLIDIFVEENLTGDRDENSQTMSFLDDELARREKGLRDAEARKAAFEQKYVGLLPGAGSIDQRMESARAELSQVESNLVAAQSSLAALSGQMASTPASVPAPNYGGNSGITTNRGRIAQLQAQLAEDQAKGWTDQHPDVVATRNQIARLAPLAASEGRGGGDAGMTANPLYVTLRSMQAEKQATAAALGSRRAQLQSDMAAFTAKQADEPGVAAEQSRLDRDYDVLKQQYDKLLADREDVRLRSDVSTKTDAVRFRVIDPPSDPRVPVAPKRPLLLALVLVGGIAAGIGAAFAQAQLAATYATGERLAKATGLPVLGSISEVLTEAGKARRAQELKWFAGGAGALAGCFLLLMLVEFVQRGLVA